MYESILAPLDGSPVAASVLPYVANLATRLEARVTLLTVLDPTRVPARASETEAWAEAQALARAQSRRLANAGAQVDIRVESGPPSETIARRAQEGGYDLIVIGTRGHSSIRRGLLGSVTDEVVRVSQVPVLVLSPRAIEASAQSDFGLDSITVPLDGSELAEGILPHAEGLARQLSLEARLVRVISLGSLAYYAGEGVTMDTAPIEEELEEDATAYLEGIVNRLSAREVRASATVLRGSPALAIMDHARSAPNTIVAISTHGRSGLGRVLIGSVADSIIRSSGAPVLVISPQ